MQKVIIDSCVFFGMIKYNNFVEKYGKENLPILLQKRKQKMEAVKQQIEACFYDDFNKKYKNLSFEEKIEKFKEYRNNKLFSLKNMIESKKNLLKGIAYDKKGNLIEIKIPKEKKEVLKKQIKEHEKELEKYIPEPEVIFNKYKLNKNSLQCGQLYQMALEGKVDLNLFFVSYNEIINHTIPRDNESWLLFSPQEVSNLTKRCCSLITTHSAQAIQDLNDLALKYRTPIEIAGRKQMAEDINALGEYGDSLIMAGASMSGIILLTQNDKDFIRDKAFKQENDYIRQNTDAINSVVSFATDALCYSVDEFLSGKYTHPTINSDTYSLNEISSSNPNFENVYELV